MNETAGKNVYKIRSRLEILTRKFAFGSFHANVNLGYCQF